MRIVRGKESMKLFIENNKLYKKTFFSTTEIDARDINRIEREDTITTVYLRSGSSIITKYWLNLLLENEASYLVDNNISYEDKTYKGNSYTASELKNKLEQTRKRAQSIASRIVKENLGENYDIDAGIVGECRYSILVFKLVENGIVLDEHQSYEEIGELNVDKAIDEMDLSFLIKWDSSTLDGLFGVTVEVDDEEALENYVIESITEKMNNKEY